eukprot:Skav201575  [mRNA]  locus=scaffold152:118918:120141:+ [translate_table: standard]
MPAYSQTGKWQEVRAKGPPERRAYHSAVWVDSLKGMLVLGGWSTTRTGIVEVRGNENDRYFSDLHLYHPDSHEWRELQPIGGYGRMSHTAVWVDGLGMLVFAGNTKHESYIPGGLNDLHLYLPATNEWQELSPKGSLPRIRSGHSAVWIDRLKGMLVFGGWTCGPGWWDYWGTDCWELNDLHLYLPETNEWQELSPYSTANGTVPKTRSHHSAVWIDGLNGMVIFGGEHCPDRGFTVWNCEQLSDMHLYLPETNEWQELQYHPGYQAHSALWIEALNRMVVTGGYECWHRGYRDGYSCGHWISLSFYYPENNTWEDVWSSADSSLLSRAGHSTVWLDGVDSGANGTLMFGGFSIEGDGSDRTWHFLNDLRLYDSVVDLDAGYDGNAGRAGVTVPGVAASLLLSMYLL